MIILPVPTATPHTASHSTYRDTPQISPHTKGRGRLWPARVQPQPRRLQRENHAPLAQPRYISYAREPWRARLRAYTCRRQHTRQSPPTHRCACRRVRRLDWTHTHIYAHTHTWFSSTPLIAILLHFTTPLTPQRKLRTAYRRLPPPPGRAPLVVGMAAHCARPRQATPYHIIPRHTIPVPHLYRTTS